MSAGTCARVAGRRLAAALLLVVVVTATSTGAPPAALTDLRVRSERGETVVRANVAAGAPLEDRTAAEAPGEGACPPDAVGCGDTFGGDVRIHLPVTPSTREASVIVGDALVSEIRVLPEPAGSSLVVFVRQRVRYEVRRGADGTTLEVRLRAAPVPAVGLGRRRTVIEPAGEEREVTVDAETIRYDQQANVIHASGGVAVSRAGTTLTANEVTVNRTTYEAEARGDVVIASEDGVVRGEHVHVNLTDETGSIEQGNIHLEETRYTVTGARMNKGVGQSYRVEDGEITTCRCGGLERPSWSIGARRLDVDLLGHGTVRGATFRVRDVPILYLPIGVFPVNTERQSGFLAPRFGQSNRRGFQYEQPFYWAINKSSDATIGLDIETAARIGATGEYRYALDRDSRGTLAGAFFNESIGTEGKGITEGTTETESTPENRWGLFTRVRQQFIGDSRAYADASLVSDDLFFREINTFAFSPSSDIAARTSFYTASRAGAITVWDHASLWGEGTYYQNLRGDDDTTFHALPRVELRAQRALFGDRVVMAFAGEGVDYQRRRGFDGVRLDLRPEVRVPFHLGNVVFGSVGGGVRETVYHLTGEDRFRTVTDLFGREHEIVERLDTNQTRETAHLGAHVGTEVARVYGFERWGFTKLRHTIEPQVAYLQVPQVSGQGDLPLFDAADRINRRSLLSYGIISRLQGRVGGGESAPTGPAAASAVRELVRLSVLQAYDTQRAIAGADHVSDVDVGLRLTPVELLALQYGTTYNVGERVVNGTSLSVAIREPWKAPSAQLAALQGPSLLGLSYRFVADRTGVQPAAGLEELDATLYLRLTNFFGFAFQVRYDLLNNVLLDKIFGGRFISRCECWMVELGVDDKANPDETQIRAQVTLVGLGSVGRGTQRDYIGLAPATGLVGRSYAR
jgi:LPS-assembly protein